MMDRISEINLINIEDRKKLLDEGKKIILSIYPSFDLNELISVFNDTVKLYNGRYPGYRKCNTEYHNLKHTVDTMLATIRLMHGAYLEKTKLNQKNIFLGAVSALMHDTGFIQSKDDKKGTGGKYTLVHVGRSINFMQSYFSKKGYPQKDFNICKNILLCTDLNIPPDKLKFQSKQVRLIGQMLGTADLICQMADRAYLERLLFLFYEFKEGNVGGYNEEFDILKRTMEFYILTKHRLNNQLGGVYKYMRTHFRVRWAIDKDLYFDYIEKNMNYLNIVLKKHQKDYRNYLRRAGVVKKLTKNKK